MTLVKPVMMNCAPIAATNSPKMRVPILSPTLPKSRCSPLPDASMTQHSRSYTPLRSPAVQPMKKGSMPKGFNIELLIDLVF